VKVRPAGASRDAAAAIARHLHDAGVGHVVAPVATLAGALSVDDGPVAVTVYPYVAGRTGVEAGLTPEHWRGLGAFARRLHATRLPPELLDLVARETYRPAEIGTVRRVDAAIPGRDGKVAETWRRHRDAILALVDRTETLGRELAQRSLPLVTCHADLHTWNVLVDDAGELWVVDWDEVVLAPKERDLMFVVGGISERLVAPADTVSFFEGYGDAEVDPLALAYYRHAWATQDIGSYAEREDADAVRIFRNLFEPGEIVELACATVT
jgi:spectinomycin phosphotransferase